MKHCAIAAALIVALALCGCGNGTNSQINGNWSATLTGSQTLAFNVTLNQASGGNVSVTNLDFTTSQSCFDTGATASGAFSVTGTTNGVSTGTFQMTVFSSQSNSNGSNELSLQGTLSNNTVTGTWNL